MGNCLSCKGDANISYSLITVRTLHIRGFSGEKRVQGVGKMIEGAVCDDCIRREIESALKPVGKVVKKVWSYGSLFVAGIVIFVAASENVYRLFGAAAALCGALCLYSDIKRAADRKKITESNSYEQNYTFYSTDLIKRNLPQKNGEEDLTYIPVDMSLTTASLGNICAAYGLLPEIAGEVKNIAREHFSPTAPDGGMET